MDSLWVHLNSLGERKTIKHHTSTLFSMVQWERSCGMPLPVTKELVFHNLGLWQINSCST